MTLICNNCNRKIKGNYITNDRKMYCDNCYGESRVYKVSDKYLNMNEFREYEVNRSRGHSNNIRTRVGDKSDEEIMKMVDEITIKRKEDESWIKKIIGR